MKTVFVQARRCVGCKQCEVACAVCHSQSRDLVAALSERPRPRPRIHADPGMAFNTSFPNKCRHCHTAPCMEVCPTGALYRPSDKPGIVAVDQSRCIACAMCAMTCPFGAIEFAPPSEPEAQQPLVATKCDDCVDRQRHGLTPCCVEACKAGALTFGEINDQVAVGRRRRAGLAIMALEPVELATSQKPKHLRHWSQWGQAVSQLNIKPQPSANRGSNS